MQKNFSTYALTIILMTGVLFFPSCMDDDALWLGNQQDYSSSSQGVFVINEGNFTYGNASLSYYDPLEKQVFNDIFFNANGLPLGDVAQSMTLRDSLGFVVINNSGRIYVINTHTFKLKGKITGLTSPRHMLFINDEKAYVSDIYGKAITIVNPQTFEITGTIEVNNPETQFYQHSTEQMIQVGNYVFTNCWSFDNAILVIDTETDQWVETLEVLIQPQSMVLDGQQNLWVLTDGGFQGNPFGHEQGGLLRINTTTLEVDTLHRFHLDDNPASLSINKTKDTLYFINRHVYRYAVASAGEPELIIESPYPSHISGGYRSLGIDPASSEIYVGDAIDHVQPGMVYRFSPSAIPVDTFRVGIIPGGFAFKNEL